MVAQNEPMALISIVMPLWGTKQLTKVIEEAEVEGELDFPFSVKVQILDSKGGEDGS